MALVAPQPAQVASTSVMSKGKVTCSIPPAALPSSFFSIMLLLSVRLSRPNSVLLSMDLRDCCSPATPRSPVHPDRPGAGPAPTYALPEVEVGHQQPCRTAM